MILLLIQCCFMFESYQYIYPLLTMRVFSIIFRLYLVKKHGSEYFFTLYASFEVFFCVIKFKIFPFACHSDWFKIFYNLSIDFI